MTNLGIKVTDLEYHRNGICGNGFTVARFSFQHESRKRIQAIATVFNTESDDNATKFTGYCAVIVLNDNGRPNIHSCWRGDHFEGDLRHFIESDAGKHMMFPRSYPAPKKKAA